MASRICHRTLPAPRELKAKTRWDNPAKRMTQASRMTMPMEETRGIAMAIRPQINIRMPQMIDHPEVFPKAVAGVFVFMFVYFFRRSSRRFSTAMRLQRLAVKEISQSPLVKTLPRVKRESLTREERSSVRARFRQSLRGAP